MEALPDLPDASTLPHSSHPHPPPPVGLRGGAGLSAKPAVRSALSLARGLVSTMHTHTCPHNQQFHTHGRSLWMLPDVRRQAALRLSLTSWRGLLAVAAAGPLSAGTLAVHVPGTHSPTAPAVTRPAGGVRSITAPTTARSLPPRFLALRPQETNPQREHPAVSPPYYFNLPHFQHYGPEKSRF